MAKDDAPAPIALDRDGFPFRVGDYADYFDGSLDPRPVVGVLEDNMIDLEIGTVRTGPVPAENYTRQRRA